MQYPVGREIEFSTKIIFLVSFLFSFWAVLITLINVAAQGYETVTVLSTDFNGTNWLWYDSFIPPSMRSVHRNCTPSTLKFDDVVANQVFMTTQSAARYAYQISGSQSPTMVGYSAPQYSNNFFQYCSVQLLAMTQYLSYPVDARVVNSAYIACNDTANIFFVLQTAGSYLDGYPLADFVPQYTNMNVSQAYVAWGVAARQIWLEIFAPSNRATSLLRLSLVEGKLDSLAIVYQDYWSDPGIFNTPAVANGSWFLDVQWTIQSSNTTFRRPIYFLPTLGVDTSQTPATTLLDVNNILSNTTHALNVNFAERAGIQVDMWKLLNWVFVVQYWSLLYNFGQVQPTLYPRISMYPANYQSNEYTDMNNIFVNDTLFEIFGSYFSGTIVPLLNLVVDSKYEIGSNVHYSFQSLNSTNRLESRRVALNLAYSCIEERLKKPLSLVISVIVADYTFINPIFGLIIIFGAWYEKRKHKHREPDDSNWCEGCAQKLVEKGNGANERSRFLSQID